jgi:hypothetical protein
MKLRVSSTEFVLLFVASAGTTTVLAAPNALTKDSLNHLTPESGYLSNQKPRRPDETFLARKQNQISSQIVESGRLPNQ